MFDAFESLSEMRTDLGGVKREHHQDGALKD